jgi:predicted metalloprotease with PDZ domain
MQTQRLWLQVVAFLVLVWAGVAAVMLLTEDYVFTPEKTLALMSESPWYENERLGHEQRMQHLDKVITSVVKLDFSQRARMREDGEETIDRFMKSLTDEEKGEYIGRVVEEHFQAVMKGIDKLPADDRRRIIGTIHRDMKKRTAKNPEMQLLIDMDPAGFEKNFTKDMGLFFKEAPLSAKLEMAPMLESFHARMQGLRR